MNWQKIVDGLKYRIEKVLKKKLSIRAKVLGQAANNQSTSGSLTGSYISPEIFRDEFCSVIQEVVSLNGVNKLLEIGSSSGEGSTAAILRGIKGKTAEHELHLFEIDQLRCLLLEGRLKGKGNVFVHNGSTITLAQFPPWENVRKFYFSQSTQLNKHALDTVESWWQADKNAIQGLPPHNSGLLDKLITAPRGREFDFVLVDGGEFSGLAETQLLYGAKFIALDDVNSFKCFAAYQLLKNSGTYQIYAENWGLRNGYAVFWRAS